jgi:hypothetical protein
MIRRMGECNANPVLPEWVAENTAAAGPRTAGPALRGLRGLGGLGALVTVAAPAPTFDYSAAGITYGGQQVVSWAQLALGVLALRSGA